MATLMVSKTFTLLQSLSFEVKLLWSSCVPLCKLLEESEDRCRGYSYTDYSLENGFPKFVIVIKFEP